MESTSNVLVTYGIRQTLLGLFGLLTVKRVRLATCFVKFVFCKDILSQYFDMPVRVSETGSSLGVFFRSCPERVSVN